MEENEKYIYLCGIYDLAKDASTLYLKRKFSSQLIRELMEAKESGLVETIEDLPTSDRVIEFSDEALVNLLKEIGERFFPEPWKTNPNLDSYKK